MFFHVLSGIYLINRVCTCVLVVVADRIIKAEAFIFQTGFLVSASIFFFLTKGRVYRYCPRVKSTYPCRWWNRNEILLNYLLYIIPLMRLFVKVRRLIVKVNIHQIIYRILFFVHVLVIVVIYRCNLKL